MPRRPWGEGTKLRNSHVKNKSNNKERRPHDDEDESRKMSRFNEENDS